MRTTRLFLTLAIVSAGTPAFAQAPTTPAVEPAANPQRLMQLLTAWETKMGGLKSFYSKCERTDTHPLTKKQTVFIGDTAILKETNAAKLKLVNASDKEDYEQILCSAGKVYVYEPRNKLIHVHQLPKSDDNLILSFIRGMQAKQAMENFELSIQKETEWYAYINVMPKSASQKQDFVQAQLVIYLKSPNGPTGPDIAMLPARLWYKEPSGKETLYLFKDTIPNANINPEAFVPYKPTKEWNVQVVDPAPEAPAPKNLQPLEKLNPTGKAPTIRP